MGRYNLIRRLWTAGLLLLLAGCGTLFLGNDPRAIRDASREALSVAMATAQAGGERAEILSRLRQAVSIDPHWALARAAYGNALYAMKNYRQALVQFKWAVNEAPENPEYKHAIGLVLLRQQKPVEALGFLVEARRLAPNNKLYRDTLLLDYIQIGRWDRAIQLWDTGAMADAPPEDRMAVEIILLAIQDRYDDAANMARRAGAKFSDDPLFPFLEGVIWEGLDRPTEAIHAYERAAARDPGSYDLRRLLTELYLRNGDYLRAERTIRRYLRSRTMRRKVTLPEKVTSWYEMANAQYQTGRYRLARRAYRRYRKYLRAFKKRSGRRLRAKGLSSDATAHFANGVIEEKKGQYPRAVSEYLRAIRGDSRFVMAYERLGQAYLLQAALSPLKKRLPLLKKAKASLEKAISIKRDLPNTYMLLGNATYQLALLEKERFRKGLLREALFLFGQAESGLRDKYTVRVFQGKISDTLEEYAQALKYYTDALKYRSKDSAVQMLIGHIQLKLKRYKAAIQMFQKARKAGANRADSAAGMALAYERLKMYDKADHYYSEVRSQLPKKKQKLKRKQSGK